LDLFQPIDAYCERLGPGVWAEPLNALTNLAFFVAAGAAFGLRRRAGGRDGAALLLIVLVAAIGVGSALFHTLAVGWTALADTIPILVFIHVYFFVAMRRLVGLGLWPALAVTVAFALAGPAVTVALAGPLGGSSGYVAPLLAILGTGALLGVLKRPGARTLFGAGALFALSLALRTADQPLCAMAPAGTHFLWHVLNATVLYGLVATVIRVGAMPAAEPRP
jgi:hypothetical protein